MGVIWSGKNKHRSMAQLDSAILYIQESICAVQRQRVAKFYTISLNLFKQCLNELA